MREQERPLSRNSGIPRAGSIALGAVAFPLSLVLARRPVNNSTRAAGLRRRVRRLRVRWVVGDRPRNEHLAVLVVDGVGVAGVVVRCKLAVHKRRSVKIGAMKTRRRGAAVVRGHSRRGGPHSRLKRGPARRFHFQRAQTEGVAGIRCSRWRRRDNLGVVGALGDARVLAINRRRRRRVDLSVLRALSDARELVLDRRQGVRSAWRLRRCSLGRGLNRRLLESADATCCARDSCDTASVAACSRSDAASAAACSRSRFAKACRRSVARSWCRSPAKAPCFAAAASSAAPR